MSFLTFLFGTNKRFKLSRKLKIPENLTPREADVFLEIMKNLSYKEIGFKLDIERKTVSKHASNIFKKLKCNSREKLEELYK